MTSPSLGCRRDIHCNAVYPVSNVSIVRWNIEGADETPNGRRKRPRDVKVTSWSSARGTCWYACARSRVHSEGLATLKGCKYVLNSRQWERVLLCYLIDGEFVITADSD